MDLNAAPPTCPMTLKSNHSVLLNAHPNLMASNDDDDAVSLSQLFTQGLEVQCEIENGQINSSSREYQVIILQMYSNILTQL